MLAERNLPRAADLSPAHWRLLFVENGVGAAVVNFGLNGAIAWLAFPRTPSMSTWGPTGLAADTVATGFFLPLVTRLIVGRIVHSRVTSGRVVALSEAQWPSTAEATPSALRDGLRLGIAGVVLGALPVVACLWLLGAGEFARNDAILCKAGFATVLGVPVTPLACWQALVHASRAR